MYRNLKNYMIGFVFNAFFAPTDHIGNTFYGFILVFLNTGSTFKEFVTFRLDDSGQRLDIGNLRVPIIDHLIEQLVNDPEIISYTFFFDFEEIISHDRNESI